MSDLATLSQRCFAPAALVTAALSAAAAAVLAAAPAAAGVPEQVEHVLLLALLGLGVVLPVGLALRHLRRPVGPLAAVAVLLLAAMVHAVCLGAPVRVAPQGLLSLLAVLLSVSTATVGLVAAADARERAAVPSRL